MIDAHVHLQDKRFDADRESLIEQAVSSGTKAFFCAATTLKDSMKVLELARRHAGVVPFVGVHPWYADEYDPSFFESLLKDNPTAGVGETGLDSVKGKISQEVAFQNQLALAARFKRPCVVHCVKAFDALFRILKQTKEMPPALLFHGFSGSVGQAKFLMRFNSFFSFSGSVLAEHREKARNVLAALPLNRIMTETDAPDQNPPDRFRVNAFETRNLPENLNLIIRGIAAIRNIDVLSMTAASEQNARLFLSGEKHEQ